MTTLVSENTSDPYFATTRLLVTENAFATPFARSPAMFLSPWLSTTPSSVTWPFFTMMRMGLMVGRAYFCNAEYP